MLVIAAPVSAQVTRGAGERVWIDVNFGVLASAAKAETFTFTTELFEEPFILEAQYPKPSSTRGVDFGGGLWLTRNLGVGLNFSQGTAKDPAGLRLEVPHPFFFEAIGIGTGDTADDLERREKATHIHVMFSPMVGGKTTIRIFGGPTFFRYRAEMVRDIIFEQLASSTSLDNEITIVDAEIVTAPVADDEGGKAIGFHVGGDVSIFFTKMIGVGGFVRFSRGTVTLDEEPMSEVAQDIKVGGVTFGGGLRIRF
jgi:hypothetical protein